MSFLSKLKIGKKADDIFVVGSDQLVTEKQSMPASQIFLGSTLAILILSILFTYGSTADLISDKEFQLRGYFEQLEKKKTEQQNLESLQVLANQVETIKEDFEVVDKAVPSDPQSENIISYLEHSIESIRKKHFLELPEAISWGLVSPNDISNNDISGAVEVYEYRLSLLGDYAALLEFFTTIKQHLRLMDIRTVRGFSLTEEGFVSADLVIWSYNIPPLF